MKVSSLPLRQFRFLILVLATILAGLSSFDTVANANDLEDLRRIQDRVQQVARQNMNVVVAVTDGIGYGSGVIVSEDGLVLTAGHVLLTGGTDVRVIFPDGREARAKPWGRNLNVDAGMVKIEEDGPWEYADLGDISELNKGDWCVCLGHSGGYELGRRPPVRAGRIINFEPDQLVTDCALIGGDSGGPLFDLQGRVIGIHSSIGSSIAENRHVSITTFRRHWDRLIAGEQWGMLPELAAESGEDEPKPERPSLGIRVDRTSGEAIIMLVHSDGAADRAGIKQDDVIIEFDQQVVRDARHLIDLIAVHQPGDSVTIKLQRGDEELVITAVLDGR
ncbi:MAG: S1C family serine protease [Pirellulaceae bacterium]